MNENMRLTVIIICLALLTACTVRQSNNSDLRLKSIMQQRTILQLNYAQLTDEFWQRTGTIFKEDSRLPMLSKNTLVLQEINEKLQLNIDQLNARLAILDNKIGSIKKKDINGHVLRISLAQGVFQYTQRSTSKPEFQQPPLKIKPNQLTIVAGEEITLQLFQQDNIAFISIQITLSELGHLYIDGQKITHLQLLTPSSIILRNTPIFAQQLFPIGHINMSLTTQPIN